MSRRRCCATIAPIATPTAPIAIASKIDPTCSTSHTSTAESTPMVANGVTISRPNWGRPDAGTPNGLQLSARTDLIRDVCGMDQLLKQNRLMAGTVVRVAALADLHCTKTSQGAFQTLFARVTESADIAIIAGDLTDYGLPEEAAVLARELTALRIPAAAVLGNHDLESGKSTEVRQILTDAGLIILDGDACELQGVGIAGVKGFGG